MPEQAIYRDKQVVFINSSRIIGVQNIEFDYSENFSEFKTLGTDSTNFAVEGPQIGQVNISSLMVGQDPFISFTGESPVNIYLLRNKSNSLDNYTAVTGYLTSYRASCSVNQVPQYQSSFQIFGDLGRLDSQFPANDFSSIAASQDPIFKPVSYRDISVSLNGFNINHIISYDLSININRRADYVLNSSLPKRVSTNYPIEVIVTFTINSSDYKAYSLKSFPNILKTTNIVITSKSGNTTLNTYSFSNMNLFSESYSSEIESKSTVTVSYKCYLNRSTSIVSDSLLLYLNASHPKSRTATEFKDLSYNRINFNLNGSTFSETGSVSLNGMDQYLSSQTQTSLKPSMSFFFVYKTTDVLTTSQGILSFGNLSINTYQESSSMSYNISGNTEYLLTNSNFEEWTYLAIVFDISTGFTYVYINGELSETLSYYSYLIESNSTVQLGYDGTYYFGGEIAKVAIYNKALTAAQVRQNYNAMLLSHQS